MKDVFEELHRSGCSALREVVELRTALTEMLFAQERLDAAVRELAGEATALAASSPHERSRRLADYAGRVSATSAAQVAAFRELKRGLDAWQIEGISPTSPHSHDRP